MQGVWTVSDLCQYIKFILDNDELLRSCVVRGEISNVSLYPSGHLYLTLKDSSSQIAGVMFQGEAKKLKFKPEEGMRIIAFGRVSIFAGRSQYQLIIQEIQPDGVGDLYVAFQQLKEKLEKEGLFEPQHKKPIPFFPKVIGIVTSLKGAVLHDMISIISRRNPSIQIIVSSSPVQGTDAPINLIAALKRLSTLPQIETIVLARGGGSPEELWCFNDESLARAIYACDIPIISAVGHETDYTIADLVADLRAPTPSAAAELLAPHSDQLKQHLVHLYGRLRLALVNQVEHAQKLLEFWTQRPAFRSPLDRVQRESQTLDLLSQRLDERFRNLLQFQESRAHLVSEKLEALNPMAVLKRGYLLAKKNGTLIKSAKEAEKAKKMQLIFHDGEVEVFPQKKGGKVSPQQQTFDLN